MLTPESNVAMEIRLTSPQDFGVTNTCVVDRVHKSAILESAVNCSCCCYKTLLKRAYILTVTLVSSGGMDEMATREILEDVIERLTTQLTFAKATLKSTSEELRQAQENLETLEKEHTRVVHQIDELKKKESELIRRKSWRKYWGWKASSTLRDSPRRGRG